MFEVRALVKDGQGLEGLERTNQCMANIEAKKLGLEMRGNNGKRNESFDHFY